MSVKLPLLIFGRPLLRQSGRVPRRRAIRFRTLAVPPRKSGWKDVRPFRSLFQDGAPAPLTPRNPEGGRELTPQPRPSVNRTPSRRNRRSQRSRGLSILLSHARGYSNPDGIVIGRESWGAIPLEGLSLGVTLFFALSGFCSIGPLLPPRWR